jgi:hypothetical protein
MMTELRFPKLQQFTWFAVLCLMAATLLLSPAPALAQSGPGPGGVNLGFDFNWNNGPAGYTASFVESDGVSLNNCVGGPITSTTSGCDFAFAYSIGGVSQTGVVSGGSYETWPSSGTGRLCDETGGIANNTAPLTLFDCFNQNSFGQLFIPGTTGTLTAFSMRITCLNPAGTPPTGLYALIYQTTNSGLHLSATPLAQTPVDLSSCPTLASWSNHTFSAADFATIPLNFSGVTLTAGNAYGVFFAGLTPGTPLPGFTPPSQPTVPTLSVWGEIFLAGILAAIGAWKLRRRAVA